MQRMLVYRILSGIALSALVACGGGGATLAPTSTGPTALQSVTLSLRVPPLSKQAVIRRPKYISPSTLGFAVVVGSSTSTTFTTTQEYAPTYAVDLTACTATNNCTTLSDGSKSFTITLDIVPGNYNLDLIAFDQAPTSLTPPTFAPSATALSKSIMTLTVTGGVAASPISLVLNGIPARLSILPNTGQTHVVPFNTVFDIVGNAPTVWSVVALDADGSIITGPGAPTISATDPSNTFAISQTSSNAFTIQAKSYAPSSIGIVFTASPPGGNGLSPVSLTDQFSTIEELWTVQDFGGAPGAVYGYPLYTLHAVPTGAIDAINDPGNLNYESVAVDAAGNIWISQCVTPYTIVEFAPTQFSVPPTQNLAATVTLPAGAATDNTIAFDSAGHLIVGVNNINKVEVYPATGGTSTPLASASATLSGGASTGLAIAPAASGPLQDSIWYTNGTTIGALTSVANGMTALTITNAPTAPVQALGFDPAGHLWITDASKNVYVYSVTGTATTATISSTPLTQVSTSTNLGSFSFGFTGNSTSAAIDAWIPGQYGGGTPDYHGFTLTCSPTCTLGTGQFGIISDPGTASAAVVAP
ncbi:MAG: NHL repeat-containing protein [Vulcanimicrobiaceae bacterium]